MRFPTITNWFRRRKRPAKHFETIHVVARVSDVPLDSARDFFIVRKDGRDMWAIFQCPCEDNHQLRVNLSKQKKPFWKCTIRNGELSLSPSVWLDYECKSHFWVDESRIYWFTGRDKESGEHS